MNHSREAVWVWSCGGEAYLHADEDGRGVSIDPERATLNSTWRLHRWAAPLGGSILQLQSIVYGRYLAATETPAAAGCHCCRAELRNYDGPEEQTDIRWQHGDVSPTTIRLVNMMRGSPLCLRANGGGNRWNTGVTVDGTNNTDEMMHWELIPIPRRDMITFVNTPRNPWELRWRRQIRFMQVVSNSIDEAAWETFEFPGRSVSSLRMELEQRLGLPPAEHFFIWVRAGQRAEFIPLVVDLPCSSDPIDIIVLPLLGDQDVHDGCLVFYESPQHLDDDNEIPDAIRSSQHQDVDSEIPRVIGSPQHQDVDSEIPHVIGSPQYQDVRSEIHDIIGSPQHQDIANEVPDVGKAPGVNGSPQHPDIDSGDPNVNGLPQHQDVDTEVPDVIGSPQPLDVDSGDPDVNVSPRHLDVDNTGLMLMDDHDTQTLTTEALM